MDSFDVEVDFGKTRDDPYSTRFNEYKEEFDNKIKQLPNEYDLRVGRKRYALDDVWEKCEKFHDTAYQWHDEGFKEEGQWESGIEKIDYEPPFEELMAPDSWGWTLMEELLGKRRFKMSLGSFSKELAFEVSSARCHVVNSSLYRRNHQDYGITDVITV
nr:RNA-directed DNA polymerase, eukaryota, reverse transcriptase zinc-binding domain protein [Tanacetum cinerariifolium]